MSEISRIELEWDSLALGTGAAPFLRPGWVRAWWDAFGGDDTLEILTHRNDEGRLEGVLPLIRRGGLVAGVANPHTPVFGAVAESNVRGELFRALFDRRPSRVDLTMLGQEDSECARGVAGRYSVHEQVVARSPFLAVAGDWDTYWRSRSQNLRKTVNRCRNRLREHGEVEIDVREGSEDLGDLLEEGFRLEATGWKGEGGTAILSDPRTAAFYRSVAEWAAREGMLRLAFLRIQGRPVAFNFSLETEEAHFLLKMGHDAAFQRTGAGTLLTAAMLERAFEKGLSRYEFLGDADRYKLRWAETTHPRARVQAFAPTPSGRAQLALRVHGRRAASRAVAVVRRLRPSASSARA